MRTNRTRWFGIVTFATALLVGPPSAASSSTANVAVGEILEPPESFSVDVVGLRNAAEGEIRDMGDKAFPARRPVVVSLALTRTAIDPVACTVNATLRDAKSGAMIAIIEALAHSNAPASSEVRTEVAHAAVRSAVRKIPNALR
jgi:hypothetical protein